MLDDDAADGQRASTDEVVAICRRRVEDFRQLSREDRDDTVQQAVAQVVDALARGVVTNLPAYARRVAYHCAVDAWRRRRAARESTLDEQSVQEQADEGAAIASLSPPTPEQLAREKHRIESLRNVAGELRALLDRAPDNYRHVLVQRYLEERSFESIVLEELDRRVASGELPAAQAGDPRHQQRVRNAVHAWHSRALRWLQLRAPDTWREVIP
jgi:RNA polymerase sigma factor (sigma-70 family)